MLKSSVISRPLLLLLRSFAFAKLYLRITNWFCLKVLFLQVQLAIDFGVKENIARQFPVFSAISSAIGRVICGYVADFKAIRFTSYYTLALALNGIVAMIGSLSSSPTHLIVYIWVYAFTDGGINVCCSSMVRETLGLDYFPEGLAVMLTASSVAVMLGSPLLGMTSSSSISTLFVFNHGPA